ncbi:hypothetical protein KDL29_08020 [bacterium]|nr:hypothetical protein [bacterium]UNM09168.1 MAG: hypothetical protein H7A35_03740 [Planctomycetales bacterium]
MKQIQTGRTGRWIALALLVLGGILSLIIFGGFLLRSQQRIQPSGDPLIDRMQRAVLAASCQPVHDRFANLMGTSQWPWAPDLKTVISWEAEFSGRSDYWCLRASLARLGVDEQGSEAGFLQRATECNDAGPEVLARAMKLELHAIRYDESLELDAWQEDAATAEIIERYRTRLPDNAAICYIAADHLSWYGLDAQYVEMLERGNSLDGLASGELFPLAIAVGAGSPAGPVLDPMIAGSLLMLRSYQSTYEYGNHNRLKDIYKELELAGSELGMARALSALMRRELRPRIDSDDPLQLTAPIVLQEVLSEIVVLHTDWEPGSLQVKGMQAWLADWQAYDAWRSGIHARVAAYDPRLAAYMNEAFTWYNLRGASASNAAAELQDYMALAGSQSNGNLLKQQALDEYALNHYLIDNEMPRCREMLEHLATFDFEHPELYVGMADDEN